MKTGTHRSKWLLASGIFSVLGAALIIILLWTARGRTASGPHSEAPTFRESEVRFESGGNTLSGVLLLPLTPGPHPAVVFLNGSGNADRTGHGVFPALWRHFARHGLASLSWDRPGVGASTGDFEAQTFPDRAAEALAALRFLQQRPEIRKDRVGLWGFSQGGIVAPLAASQSSEVAFLIEVGGCQLPAWQQDLFRVEAELRADGFKEADIAKARELAELRMDLMRKGEAFEELDETQKALMARPWFEYVHYCDRKRFESGKITVEFDPGPCWEKVHCPVLALFGEKDTSCPAQPSIDVIRKGLEKAGNGNLTIKTFPRADHRITVSETGGRKEAAQRAKTRPAAEGPEFAPGYLDTMSTWLVKRFRSAK
jgi:dienelactone hydrolase